MHLHSRVLGGIGPKIEQDDDTFLLEPNNPYNTTFRIHSCIATESRSHQESPVPTSPASSDSSFSPESSTHSEPDPPCRGEPAWIARPRNPFIIFRCEYSREHSHGDGKCIRGLPGSPPVEKTLSKKAAEAWHQLSPREKNRFKELADKEKEEPTRLYPNYRFKPMKRGTASGAASCVVVKTRAPQPLMPKPHSQSLRADGHILALSPCYPLQQTVSDPPFSTPSLTLSDTAVVKAGRRRSASDPSCFGQHYYIPRVWSPRLPRLVMKHSRSAMGSRPPFHFPDTPGESFGGLVQDILPSQSYSWADPTTSGIGTYATESPSSSYLSGWNGENSSPRAMASVVTNHEQRHRHCSIFLQRHAV